MKKVNKKTYFVIAITVIFAGLFTHFYVPRFITEIKNVFIEIVRADYLKTNHPSFSDNISDGKLLRYDSYDNKKLTAYITYSKTEDAKGTILLIHGIRSKKEQFIQMSEQLANQGFHAVAIDLRAHGQSEGTHCTFGVKEKKDISALIDVLENKEHINLPIGVWGQSLGGAIGLQVMALDNRIDFGVIESTFADFTVITNDYFKQYLGFNNKSFSKYLTQRAGKIAGFDPNEARPIIHCENIHQPILLVHGQNDRRINIDYAKSNYQSLGSKDKTFIEIAGADHVDVWEVGGKEYIEKVFTFFLENAN